MTPIKLKVISNIFRSKTLNSVFGILTTAEIKGPKNRGKKRRKIANQPKIEGKFRQNGNRHCLVIINIADCRN